MQRSGGSPEHVQAIDVARAVAIVGVVFNHTVDGLVTAGIVDASSRMSVFNQALYIFRMPALAFILGLFIARGAEKRGTPGYIRERVTFALYAYLVWFVLQTLVEVAASNVKNTPRGWDGFLEFWAMPGHLWFMPFLATSTVLISLAAPWRNKTRGVVVLAAVAACTVLTWGWNPTVFGMRGLSLLLFTAVGAAVGSRRLGSAMSQNPFGWACFGVVSLSGFMLLNRVNIRPGTLNDPDAYNLGDNALSALAAALGVVILISLAVLLSRAPAVGGWLGRTIGTKTLEIYLAHVMIVAATRIVLGLLGATSELTFLVAAMLLGVGAPLLLAALAPRLRLSWLFQVPGSLGVWSRAANKPNLITARQTR
jgi:fucose 4-O-acetylase-like acetyltransferase